MQRVAVLFIHGIEIEDPNFADTPTRLLHRHFGEQFARLGPVPEEAVVCEPVHWAPEVQPAEEKLFKQHFSGDADGFFESLETGAKEMNRGSQTAMMRFAPLLMRRKDPRLGKLNYPGLRWLMMHFVGDALAYQPTPGGRAVYDGIHVKVAEALARLRRRAGDTAPLCVVAHSLGSVIASNFFYDLQRERVTGKPLPGERVKAALGNSPLERGETLAHMYTLGSPLALWTLRYPQQTFDAPVTVAAPELARHHPGLEGEWVNYYDDDDIFAWPLRPLSDSYRRLVRDERVSLKGPLLSWTPMVHPFYWADDAVMLPIAKALAGTWRQLNATSGRSEARRSA
ncbi:hypothetical protein P2318_00375 [Myxococcaceae bacterium GXIMD 01537]